MSQQVAYQQHMVMLGIYCSPLKNLHYLHTYINKYAWSYNVSPPLITLTSTHHPHLHFLTQELLVAVPTLNWSIPAVDHMLFHLVRRECHHARGVGTPLWLSWTHPIMGGVLLILSLPQAVVGTSHNQHREISGGSSVRETLGGEGH